jgi:hypothetical protein
LDIGRGEEKEERNKNSNTWIHRDAIGGGGVREWRALTHARIRRQLFVDVIVIVIVTAKVMRSSWPCRVIEGWRWDDGWMDGLDWSWRHVPDSEAGEKRNRVRSVVVV